jgi:hypothetical protein
MSTVYTEQELRRLAKKEIKDEARAAKIKAKFLRWELRTHDHGATLVAIGLREDGYQFSLTIAI